ncbi:hypothetical protein L0Y40_01970 [Candidatus Wolfebacteria bacterium]|nr:hypothetical protein [Candidatus Wolfebacteria bacterium]
MLLILAGLAGLVAIASIAFSLILWRVGAPEQEEGCPDWFAEYVEYAADKMNTSSVDIECVWTDRSDFVPERRGWVQATAYPALVEDDMIRERITVGFTSFNFDLLRGRQRGKIEVFATPSDPTGDHVQNLRIEGNAVYFDLDAQELLERDWGQFTVTFNVVRPIRVDEVMLMDQTGRPTDYFLEVVVREGKEAVIFTVSDPREHLFYRWTAFRGKVEMVHFWLDKWYGEDGSVTRMVATRIN